VAAGARLRFMAGGLDGSGLRFVRDDPLQHTFVLKDVAKMCACRPRLLFVGRDDL